MNKSAWYDEESLPEQMVQGALGQIPGWQRLENTDHFAILNDFVKQLSDEINSIVDIGCGAGELLRVFEGYEKYMVGYDLPHIINNVAKVMHPDRVFKTFDANTSDFEFVKEYDIVICNSFLSELTNAIVVLDKIVVNLFPGSYLIIHRQEITMQPKSFIETYTTYAGLETPKYIMSYSEIMNIFSDNDCMAIQQKNITDTQVSLLVQKR